VKPKGEDTAAALREWIKDEIKNAPSSRTELGKFFFGVSTASLGVLVAFKNLDKSIIPNWPVGASLLLLFFATLIALFMVTPRIWPLHGETDLFELHEKQVRGIARSILLWFATWLLGVAIGIYAVLMK
jgi:hypothetical protein